MPHPAATDPAIIAGQSIIGRIRTATAPHEWLALSKDLDHCNPQDLVSALAIACALRAEEATEDQLLSSYERGLLETE